MIKASEKFVRLIIRRPLAYDFRDNVVKDESTPIPGVAFLDAQAKLIGTARLAVTTLVEQMNQLAK